MEKPKLSNDRFNWKFFYFPCFFVPQITVISSAMLDDHSTVCPLLWLPAPGRHSTCYLMFLATPGDQRASKQRKKQTNS
eukprot:4187746-Amphidinium_carterae.1